MLGSSSRTSTIRSPDALEKVIVTITIANIRRLIRIFAVYENKLISCPVVRFPATIFFAPNHESRIIHEYMQNCIAGATNIIIFSAFNNVFLKPSVEFLNLLIS